MTKKHICICALYVFAFCFAAPAAPANPQLLAQIDYGSGASSASSHGQPLPTSMTYWFSIGGSTGFGSWSHDATASDVGHTFRPGNLAGIMAGWHAPDLEAAFQIGWLASSEELHNLDELLNAGNFTVGGAHGTALVANPTSYDLSDVTVTIDSFEIDETSQGVLYYLGTMSVRFYAAAVPEPSGLALLPLALCFLVWHRRR